MPVIYSPTIDTLKIYKRLKNTGMNENTAEEIAKILWEIEQQRINNSEKN